jgi:adenine-specific DNA-methyltransferase
MTTADMVRAEQSQLQLFNSVGESGDVRLPDRAATYPEFRYMGSKRRLLPWIYGVLRELDFEVAADPFVGSGCVAYLLKAMGKRVIASDFLRFPTVLAEATVANNSTRLDDSTIARLFAPRQHGPSFIERTFTGVFFAPDDLRFLDRVCGNLDELDGKHQRTLAQAALIRACLKKQPRGVFTVSGDLSHYDDGRRDLRLSIQEHFVEQVDVLNRVVFDNGLQHTVLQSDVFDLDPADVDLVYLDPPYVPSSDDNCYVKRYHFLEGLSRYWEGVRILENTKVKKIEKMHTPFSYRRTAVDAFARLFSMYADSTIVLSYSSNGYPDRAQLEQLMRQYKSSVTTYEKPHRYHFGTHAKVRRATVQEYLIVGR